MIKNMKRSFKVGIGMMKYSLAVKTNLILMGVMLAVGLFYEITFVTERVGTSISSSIVNYNGIWMLAMLPMYAIQLMYGVSLSGLVQSSDAKRILLVDCSTLFKAISEIICFGIVAASRYIACKNVGEETNQILFGLLFFGVFSIFITVYNVVIYRYTTIGYVVILPVIIILMIIPIIMGRHATVISPAILMEKLVISNSYTLCLLAGIGLVALDICLFYFLSRVLYSVPLSEKAFKQLLARSK